MMSLEPGPLKVNSWSWPERLVFEGRYCRLEPLEMRHAEDLFAASTCEDAASRYRYLFSMSPSNRADFDEWLNTLMQKADPTTYVVVDKATGKVEGRQSLMRIIPEHGVVEIGSVLWGPNIARTRVTTEAFYLLTSYVFDTLHYRRYEWKCNNDNEASRRAAIRFGFQFEGVFRQHLIQHGYNRNTAWFSMLDSEWPTLKPSFEAWLHPDNFDEQGQQKKKLEEFR